MMEGREPYLDSGLWSLFPDRFDSERKPDGWIQSAIGDEARVVGGGTPSTRESGFWGGSLNWATPKDLSLLSTPVLLATARKLTEEGVSKISSGMLPQGTVLLSSRAPIGYVAIAEVPVAVGRGFIALECDQSLGNMFIWLWVVESMKAILAKANGSTFQEVSKKNFRPLPILRPPQKLHDAFDQIVRPLYERMVMAEREARSLVQVRDALLPRLMSGELRIRDAERMAEAVT
jgi:type I restriction enzyme S subunit